MAKKKQKLCLVLHRKSAKDVHFNLDGEPTLESRLTFSVLPKHLRVVYGVG